MSRRHSSLVDFNRLDSHDRLLIYKEMMEHSRTTSYYKDFNKKYKKIKGYTDFSEVAARLAYFTWMARTSEFKMFSEEDKTITSAIIYAEILRQYNFQVYWLDKTLLDSFLITDTPRNLSDLEIMIPRFILMLPPVLKNPEGFFVDWLYFVYVPKIGMPKEIKLENFTIFGTRDDNDEYDKLHWTTMLISGETYSSTVEIRPNEKEPIAHGEFSFSPTMDFVHNASPDKEKEFTKMIERILVNTLLYLQLKPDDKIEESETLLLDTSGRGFNQKKKLLEPPPEYFLNPVWIGKGYKPQKKKLSKKDFDEEARKYQIHTKSFWRRGHYRRVPIGKREDGQYKLVKIDPVLITR